MSNSNFDLSEGRPLESSLEAFKVWSTELLSQITDATASIIHEPTASILAVAYKGRMTSPETRQ
jgi:hypothetical protein